MGVSTFFGCLSLETGAIIIGILQLIGALFLCQYSPDLSYDEHASFWTPMLPLQITFVVLLFIGIKKRNGDYVFPFVCLYYVIVMLLIFNTTTQVLWNLFNTYRLKDEWLIILLKITIINVMCYFLRVMYTFYKQLIHETFTSSSSTSSTNYINMKNNEEIHKQAIKQILAEEGIAKCHENIKK